MLSYRDETVDEGLDRLMRAFKVHRAPRRGTRPAPDAAQPNPANQTPPVSVRPSVRSRDAVVGYRAGPSDSLPGR